MTDKSNQEIIESMFKFGDFVLLDKDTDGGEGLFKGAVMMVCGNNPTFLGPEDPYAMRLMMLCAPCDEDDHVDSGRNCVCPGSLSFRCFGRLAGH